MRFDLAVTVRDKSGKGAARQLRRSGKVPGVLYGQGECLLITIEPEPLIKILKSQAGGTALISLSITGAKSKPKRTALLRDFQVDPVEGQVLHADLFEISMDKPIRVKVPVHVTGGRQPVSKKAESCTIIRANCTWNVLPAALPDYIEVDASPLAIGQGIHLKEIAKKENVRYLDDPEQMVVSVAAPMSDAKLEALLTSQAVGPEGAKEPEVVAKGKALEEGVEGAAAAPGAAAPAAGAEAKAGEKKEGAPAAAAPKAEKKEAEKKK